jgi:hypothetical protein
MDDGVAIHVVRVSCIRCKVELNDDTSGGVCSASKHRHPMFRTHQWITSRSVVVCPCDRPVDPRDAADMGMP